MLNEIYHMLDPVAFAVGPFVVRWYGIAYVAGFLCAALVLWQVAKRWKVRVNADSLLTVVLCAIVGVILGGRLGYVLVYGDGYYFSHPAEILAFNHGGMSFHGGLIGALLSGLVAARFTGIPYLTLADMGCIAAPIGLFFGRCANFVNGELWGAPTSLPWGVVFGGAAGAMPRHPSQLYEALLEGVVLVCVHVARVRVQQLHLARDGLGDDRVAVAHGGDVVVHVQILGAVGVEQTRAAAAHQVQRVLVEQAVARPEHLAARDKVVQFAA